MSQPASKRPPKPSDKRKIQLGRAHVTWGPQTYGKPKILAVAPVECIDDLVAAVLEAQAEIRGRSHACNTPTGPPCWCEL